MFKTFQGRRASMATVVTEEFSKTQQGLGLPYESPSSQQMYLSTEPDLSQMHHCKHGNKLLS